MTGPPTPTPNMGLSAPTLTQKSDVEMLRTDLNLIDAHTHASGKGALVPASGLAFSTLVKIAETILTVDTALITFSVIPQIYRNLRLAMTALGKAGSGNVGIRNNGDSGAHYDYVVGYGNQGNNATTFEVLADTMWQLGWVADTTAPAGQAGSAIITIFDYARTVWRKNALAEFYSSDQLTGQIYWIRSGGTWRSTAAVTSLQVLDSAGANYAAGSIFTLYGEP